MTKDKAYKIMTEVYKTSEYHYAICFTIHTELYDDWMVYWYNINKDKHRTIPVYWPSGYWTMSTEEKAILRLLTLSIFIEDTYK